MGRSVAEVEALYRQHGAALSQVVSSYVAFLQDETKLPILKDAITNAPAEFASLIPNPTRVREQKQELADKLQQTRALMQ